MPHPSLSSPPIFTWRSVCAPSKDGGPTGPGSALGGRGEGGAHPPATNADVQKRMDEPWKCPLGGEGCGRFLEYTKKYVKNIISEALLPRNKGDCWSRLLFRWHINGGFLSPAPLVPACGTVAQTVSPVLQTEHDNEGRTRARLPVSRGLQRRRPPRACLLLPIRFSTDRHGVRTPWIDPLQARRHRPDVRRTPDGGSPRIALFRGLRSAVSPDGRRDAVGRNLS
jgi:hypothetical protein